MLFLKTELIRVNSEFAKKTIYHEKNYLPAVMFRFASKTSDMTLLWNEMDKLKTELNYKDSQKE